MFRMLLPTLPPGVTTVLAVHLYPDEAHTGAAVEAPVALQGGKWTVDTLNVPPGRYYPTVDAMKDTVAYSYPLPYVDLPEDDRLVVSPEDVAVDAGMTLPLTSTQRQTITSAIRSAQADVVTFLGRPITPTVYVETDRYAWYDGWNLVAAPDEPLVSYVSVVPQLDPVTGVPTDYFTVTYLAGLDGKNDEALDPIREYVKIHAMNKPSFLRMWRTATNAEGEVRSLSAEGQSVSFTPATLGGGGKAGSGDPGALPTLGSLDRWRVAGRRVYQAPTRTTVFPWQASL